MNPSAAATSTNASQRALQRALALVREALVLAGEGAVAPSPPPNGPAPVEATGGSDGQDPDESGAALDALTDAFGLTPFERNVIVLCAGVELDERFPLLCAAAQGDPKRTYATFGLALSLFPDAHWSAIGPQGALRGFDLVDVGAGERLLGSPVRLNERVLHELLGAGGLDERLAAMVRRAPSAEALPPSQQAAAQRIAGLWGGRAPVPGIHLCGDDAASRTAVAAAVCSMLGLKLHVLAANDIPHGGAERHLLIRLWQREALLSGSALLLECEEADAEGVRAAAGVAERMPFLLFVSGRDPVALPTRRAVRVDVHKPSAPEQRALFRSALGPLRESVNGQVDRVVGQFNLGAQSISVAALSLTGAHDAPELSGESLWDACRAQARPRLEELAQRIESTATFEDLVVGEAQVRSLREIVAQVRHRAMVYEQWGFARKGALGRGVNVLFAGASGTGKTLAAEVLSEELRLDLYRIDLSQVVSKYIGETEKNLRRIFDAAEEGGAVLLFDEADALFGKRSEVRDSHDRYANIEVSYLLQRMDLYRGLSILTTNMKDSLDKAFLRRLRFVVQFPVPDVGQRAKIWHRVFPEQTPLDGVDVEKLARLNIAGGNIRNIALSAAFVAAAAGEPVRMAHLLHATRGEYAKLEKSLTDHEIGGW